MQYQLNFTIDSTAVTNINAACQYITITKSVDTSGGNSNAVSWISFAPLESDVVTWQEEYYIYASTTEVTDGAKIMMTSQTGSPVVDDQLYTLASGAFTSGAGGSNAGFTTENSNGSTLSFGLAQPANVNNSAQATSPLNALVVLNNETATFNPIETVSIFLSGQSSNGVVISQVQGNALEVQLTAAQPVANIGFNDAENTFTLTSLSAVVDKRSLHARLPKNAPRR